MTSDVSVVILAGGKASPELQAAMGVTNRALVPLCGRIMLDYVVDAFDRASTVGSLCVVGDVPSDPRYTTAEDHGDMFDNLMAGLAAVDGGGNAVDEGTPAGTSNVDGGRVLVATSDIPFVTASAIDAFVEAAMAHDVDFVYPIVDMAAYRKRFAVLKRTTVRLSEGEFTGGNIVMLKSEFVRSQSEKIREAYALRKDVFKLGALLGPGLLMRLIVSQSVAPSVLSIPMLEAGVSRLLGADATVAAIVTEHPEIGTDIDTPEEIEIAVKILGSQPAMTAA